MAPMSKSVLIIDDERPAQVTLANAFQENDEFGFEVELAADEYEAARKLEHRRFDVVIIDMELSTGKEGGLWLMERVLLNSCPDAVKIVVTAYSSVDNCKKAMRPTAGAWDYIDKGGHEYGRLAVDSAVSRLKELAEEQAHEDHIFSEWLPENEVDLQKEHAGEYVAVLEDRVIASAPSLAELGVKLHEDHAPAKRPFVLHVKADEAQ